MINNDKTKNLRRRTLLSSQSDSALKQLQINDNKPKQQPQIKYQNDGILTRDQISMEFREQYIIRGYRAPNNSILMCIKSVFKLNNNETLNFWTHFIPFLIMSGLLINFSLQNDIINDNYTWPFFIYLLTAAFFLLMSSLAHALNCMSTTARHVCFILDYLSISMYGMGCCIGYKSYSLSNMPPYTVTFFRYYVTIAMCVTIVSNVMASASRFVLSPSARSLLRLFSFVIQYIFVSSPLFFRLTMKYIPGSAFYLNSLLKFLFDYNSSESIDRTESHKWYEKAHETTNDESDFYYFLQIVAALISAFLYASHIPERYFPYIFDIVGQSHQIFHITTGVCTFLQMKALSSDMAYLRPMFHLLAADKNESLQVDSLAINRTLVDGLNNHTMLTHSVAQMNLNFYSHSMQDSEFLTVTLSPYFCTKLTYAFIMLCCVTMNTMILVYYYFKAVYFNPWTKLNMSMVQNTCAFCPCLIIDESSKIIDDDKEDESSGVTNACGDALNNNENHLLCDDCCGDSEYVKLVESLDAHELSNSCKCVMSN